jgi:tight adherence protein C
MAPAATIGWEGDGRPAALLLGAAWAVAVAAATTAALRRRAHRRPAGPPPRPPVPAAPADRPGRPGPGVVHRSPIAALGSAVRRLSPAATTPPPAPTGGVAPARSPADEAADRRAGWAVLAGLGLLAVAPPLAAVPVVWSVAAPAVAARRRQAAMEARLHDQLPDVVDLLTLTAGAGLPVGAALVALGDRPGGPLGAALARAGAHVRHGGSTAEALALLSAASPGARPLVDALAQHDRYGSPLLPALERVAIEARARRRRRAEEAARRLPVTLLLPLVLTTFPAFVLLTVIPLLAGSLGSLSLSPT